MRVMTFPSLTLTLSLCIGHWAECGIGAFRRRLPKSQLTSRAFRSAIKPDEKCFEDLWRGRIFSDNWMIIDDYCLPSYQTAAESNSRHSIIFHYISHDLNSLFKGLAIRGILSNATLVGENWVNVPFQKLHQFSWQNTAQIGSSDLNSFNTRHVRFLESISCAW